MRIPASACGLVVLAVLSGGAPCGHAHRAYGGLVSEKTSVARTREQGRQSPSPGETAGSIIHRLDGSTITGAEAERTVTGLMKAAEVTGTGIAIINNGKIAYLKAYGLRDKERNLPLTVDTVMSVASLSKSAFAYMTMRLVDQGRLNLDRPLYQYLPKPQPEYANYADLASDERYKRITARMLLSHTSGFANFRGAEKDGKLKIHFEPGSRFAYSGEGINLLQFVVETITGKPLEQLMQELVFQPLGMTRTSMIWQDRFESDYANNYDENGKPLPPPKWHEAFAAGSMLTTVADCSRFIEAVLDGKFVRKQTLDQMLGVQIEITSKHEFPTLSDETTDENKPIRLSYGLGWGLYWSPYGKAFFKEGYNDGWRDYTVSFEKPKSGILIMSNSGNGQGIFKDLLENLQRNTFTPIEWERFTPSDKLPPRKSSAQ
jgi:CubicO group peptidase (beta-lactamase class C family)